MVQESLGFRLSFFPSAFLGISTWYLISMSSSSFLCALTKTSCILGEISKPVETKEDENEKCSILIVLLTSKVEPNLIHNVYLAEFLKRFLPNDMRFAQYSLTAASVIIELNIDEM